MTSPILKVLTFPYFYFLQTSIPKFQKLKHSQIVLRVLFSSTTPTKRGHCCLWGNSHYYYYCSIVLLSRQVFQLPPVSKRICPQPLWGLRSLEETLAGEGEEAMGKFYAVARGREVGIFMTWSVSRSLLLKNIFYVILFLLWP